MVYHLDESTRISHLRRYYENAQASDGTSPFYRFENLSTFQSSLFRLKLIWSLKHYFKAEQTNIYPSVSTKFTYTECLWLIVTNRKFLNWFHWFVLLLRKIFMFTEMFKSWRNNLNSVYSRQSSKKKKKNQETLSFWILFF